MAFVMAGGTPANAFGSEFLGCSVDGAAWTASTCNEGNGAGTTSIVEFAVHNLSGTYTYAWTVASGTITGGCSTTAIPCIYRGCTSTASICDIKVGGGSLHDKTYSASVKLTQSGRSRTISASATIVADDSICLTC